MLMREDELEEAFNLICERERELDYPNWILSNYPMYKEFFQIQHDVTRDLTPQPTTARDGEPSFIHESSVSLIGTADLDKSKVQSARNKIENYLQSQDISLGVMF